MASLPAFHNEPYTDFSIPANRQAMEAAQQWKFAPAQVNGKAAPSTWILHFGFRRSGTEVVPQEGKS